MTKGLRRYFATLLLTTAVATGGAGAADPANAEKDILKATLLESKEKSRGVTIYTNGASISIVVVSVDDQYVVGRSNQTSRVVIRLDRIDGVAAMF